MVIFIVFIGFLLVEAYQDFKTGEVDLWLLLLSFVVTVLMGRDTLYFLPAAIVSMVCVSLIALKKLGSADFIILTQISLLFGSSILLSTLVLSSVIGLAWGIVKYVTGSRAVRFKKMEIRFVPCILLGMVATKIISFGL